mmetsp:Transcript_22227/g.36349  ORF Transcript_22227/g.36349 Transcript_22227/m.36349 type:complete len:1480 (+) Transcript_22227:3-4442(+)
MLETTNEHLADIAAGSPPAAATTADDESVTAAARAINEPEPLDPAYIQTLQLLAEKKVREAEEKAKMDEEAEWFAAAEKSSNDNNNNNSAAADLAEKEGGNNNNNSNPTTEDILQSIEESVDYNNQTSGFVASFALPLTPIAPDHDESYSNQEVDNYDDSDDDSNHDDVKESLSAQHKDSQKKITTRQQGTSSPASIFRTASSSSSASPRNNVGVSSPSSPYGDSVASDSTEFTNNTNTSLSLITPYKLPQHHHQQLSHVAETIVEEVVSPLASPLVTRNKKQMSNDDKEVNKQHHPSRITKQKPKQQIPTIQRSNVKSSSGNVPSTKTRTGTSWTKRKNNLVISPIPITKKQLKQPTQQTKVTQSVKSEPTSITKNITSKPTVTIDTSPIQLSNKPPTHPSTKVPSTSPSFQPILRTHSTQSDADVSIDLSEATPITTPAKSSWFRTYSSEDETEEGGGLSSGTKKENYWGSSGVSVDDDEEEDNDDSFFNYNAANDAIHQQQTGKISQSSTDLVGLEIFEFDPSAQHDDITPKNNNCTTNNNVLSTNNKGNDNVKNQVMDNPLNSSTEYTVSSLFNPSSNRQYKNENLFFNGIYQSGLQSSSFEQVDNTSEDMMCMDAEIELVYNSSGAEQPSFLVDGDITTDTSFASSSVGVVADDLEECASVEERRKVVRRIQQWRRGRRARESSSSAKDDSANGDGDDEEVEENEENDFNYDYDDDDAIEMAPLTPAKGDNNDLNDYIGSSASKDPRRRMTGPSSFFGNLLWNSQPSRDEYSLNRRRKEPRYDDIDFDRNTDKCFHCFTRWKKLMVITVMLLLFGSLLSGDGLEKHHMDDSYNVYGENDPLAKSNFVEQGHLPDDTDDYDGLLSYHSSGVPTHLIHDAEIIKNYQQSPNPGVVADDVWFHFEMGDDEFDTTLFGDLEWETDDGVNDGIVAGPLVEQPHLIKAEQYNALVGIDRIVVLGDQLSGVDWLVDKLKRLYPDLVIQNGFQDNNAGKSGRALRGSISQARRFTKVIDPLSDEVIGKEDDVDDSKYTLVIALFLNPYDWVALMHASQQSNKVSWRDYLSTEWQSHANILEYRASMVSSAVIDSVGREDVKLVIPLKYEKLLNSFSNFDNYVSSSGTTAPELPGIVGVIDDIQSRTGLRADEAAGWKEPRDRNQFWADPIGCNGHVCHPKIQKLREDAEYISYINEHVDWKAEHLIGYQQMMTPKLAIEQIVVLGERHSGAEWLVDRLSRCFPDVNVKYGFGSRPGKFFQTEPTKAQPNTLVISVFVNPFDWVDMMRHNPINAPTHKDLDWTDFVTTPWERKRSSIDENLEDTASAVCSYGFAFDEVIPCMTQRDPNTDSFPLYELRPDGTSYANLLELREDKIKNFLSTANFEGVVDHIEIRYEDLVWDDDYTDDALYLTLPFPGIAGLLEKIRDQTKLVPDISAGWILDEDGLFRAEHLGVGVAKLDPYFVQWMEDNIDWEVEDLVGYSP